MSEQLSLLILAYAVGFALAFAGALFGMVVLIDEVRRRLRQWRAPAVLRTHALG